MDVTTRSPLRYPGGKTRAVKLLLPYFTGAHRVVAPFLGGGSVELALTGAGTQVIAGDAFGLLANFWQVMMTDPAALADALDPVVGTMTKDTYADHQRALREVNVDSSTEPWEVRLDRARMFFIVNRCSFSGSTLSGGFSTQAARDRFTPSSVDRVRHFSNPLLTVSCSGYEDTLEKIHDDDMVFCDPPYMLGGTRDKLYGVSGDQHDTFDHEQFRKDIDAVDAPVVITYNDSPEVRDLWSGYEITPARWSYGMNASKSSSEIIITR